MSFMYRPLALCNSMSWPALLSFPLNSSCNSNEPPCLCILLTCNDHAFLRIFIYAPSSSIVLYPLPSSKSYPVFNILVPWRSFQLNLVTMVYHFSQFLLYFYCNTQFLNVDYIVLSLNFGS